MRILLQRHNWVIFLRKRASRGRYSQWRWLAGHVERMFVHKNWKGGYWQHLISTERRYVPHSWSCTPCFKHCFWRSHYQPQSWATIWYSWTIICRVPSKISVTLTTYIIGHYNPSVRIIDLVSHTTYDVYVGLYSLKSTPNDRFFFFWETFHGNFILTLRVFARNLLRENRRRYTFRISFWYLAWD